MIHIQDKKDCCGCTACQSICPKDAISMKPDAFGFLYPNVDENKCIDCGLCEKVCAFNDDYDKSLNLPEPVAYGARHKDMNQIMKSRSGAAFVAISDYIIENGGVVYGAGYKDHFRVAHKRAVTKDEREEFRGSKYVQSDLTGVYKQVKDDLKKGMIVLFSGTPCQTSGLNSYIGKQLRSNLLLMDIVCHGVPGPYLWRDYINYLEKKQDNVITEVNFRNKEKFGWRAHRESFKYQNDTYTYTYTYTYTFYKHIAFRYSCGICHFCNTIRPSDITIADFWGWEKTNPTFNIDNKGASLILCNTQKGLALFNVVKDRMNIIPVSLSNALQTHLRKPSDIHPKRQSFEEDYAKYGFEHAMKKFGMMGWRITYRKLKRRIKNMLKILLKNNHD